MIERKLYRTGVDVTLDVINGKWKSTILCYLGKGPLRYAQIAIIPLWLSDEIQ